jgi:hypothetical protein
MAEISNLEDKISAVGGVLKSDNNLEHQKSHLKYEMASYLI